MRRWPAALAGPEPHVCCQAGSSRCGRSRSLRSANRQASSSLGCFAECVAGAEEAQPARADLSARRDGPDPAGEPRPRLLVVDDEESITDLDGFEVQRRLVADRLRVPILFLTARDETESKVRGLTMGADDYVTKPFSLEELVA